MSLPMGKNLLQRLVSLIGHYQLGRLVSPYGKNQVGRLVSLFAKTQLQRLVSLPGTYHSEMTTFGCDYCTNIFTDKNDLIIHCTKKHTEEYQEQLFQCHLCSNIFSDIQNLNSHAALSHVTLCDTAGSVEIESPQPGDLYPESISTKSCNNCGNVTTSSYNPGDHIGSHHAPCIPQLDGNDSLVSVPESDLTPRPGPSSENISYNYSLNVNNQATRLVTNASKPPLEITQNSFRNIGGDNCATNVTLQFNAGVYLTAIKPVLSSLKVGWKTEVSHWSILCTNLSNRDDNTQQHLLCTQLTLVIKGKDNLDISHQATLHLYHTKDKIQIQGSTLVSPGVSSASWIAENIF